MTVFDGVFILGFMLGYFVNDLANEVGRKKALKHWLQRFERLNKKYQQCLDGRTGR